LNTLLKMHIFKMFLDPMEHKDLFLGAREDMGDMERYWDVTEGVRDIMGNKKRDWATTGFLGLIMRTNIGHHRGVLAQVGVPGGVDGHQGGLQGQVVLLGGVNRHHGGLQGQAGEPV
jgi:hypothetical protein